MTPPSSALNARRLRWALLFALALHLVLLWRYAPRLFSRFDAPPAQEEIVEIAPPPPQKSPGLELQTQLQAGSPERLAPQLPKNFFPKISAVASGQLQLSDDIDIARASGAEVVASIIPAAVRLPGINALSEKARTPKPSATTEQKPQRTPPPPLKAPAPVSVPPELPVLKEMQARDTQVPFLLPQAQDNFDVDATIARATNAAAESARAANSAAPSKPPPDYRALLPQGPLVAAAPLPLSRGTPLNSSNDSAGITTYALDAPVAKDNLRAAADEGKRSSETRQQYFSLLTARLKATNQRLLAEAVKAGPRTTVRMQFLVDRDGRVLDISAVDQVDAALLARATAVIRSTPLPPVPAAMAKVPVELSFPVEVYR